MYEEQGTGRDCEPSWSFEEAETESGNPLVRDFSMSTGKDNGLWFGH